MGNILTRNLQPLTLILISGLWLCLHKIPYIYFILMALLMILLTICEYLTGKSQNFAKYELVTELVFLIGTFFIYGPSIYTWLAQEMVPLKDSIHPTFWPHQWPLLGKALLAFFISDFLTYWFHRLEHGLKWAFKIHGLHHSSNHFNWRKTLINHPLEFLMMNFCVLLPSLFGAKESELTGAGLMAYCTAFFSHSNIVPQSRWLSHIFVTNEYHARHHSVAPKERLSNYCCSLSIWDRMFGTFRGYEYSGELGLSVHEKSENIVHQILFPF